MSLISTLVARLLAMLEPARVAGGVVLMIGYENWWVTAIEPVDADL